jgi:hypothetical protein
MSIRPLDLLDLPTLYRYRGEAVSFDATRQLTRGNPLGAIGVMAYINPRRHIYSAVSAKDGPTLLGGIIHTYGETFAKILYLAPASQMDNRALPELIENLTSEAGKWGAFHVLAEVDEMSEAFLPLRAAGFSVYAWQRMWDVSALMSADLDSKWLRVRSIDLPSVQSLFHQIVPPLLQPLERMPKRAIGFMCNEGVKCYVSTASGMAGIVLFPLIHPEATEVSAKLLSIIKQLPNRSGRPIYFCVRSYQAWLEPVLEDLGAKSAARQAVMVKHLTRLAKDEQTVRAAQPVGVSVQPSRVSRIAGKKESTTVIK